MMKEMISVCGLRCHECGALLATKEDDNAKRADVARQWSKLFNVEIRPESINCDGCLSDGGRLFEYCQVCEVRRCGLEKGFANCAHCSEYACGKLEEVFRAAPEARKSLDGIKATIRSSTENVF